MSATRDLIAAALTAADELDEINTIVHVGGAVANQLREACAHAMVQPDMAEVERLVREYGACIVHFAPGDDIETLERLNQLVSQKRAALLDYVRQFAATHQPLREASDADMQVYQAIADGYTRDTQSVSAAEVPMPKPVAYGFGNTAVTGHTNRLMMVRIDIPGGDQYAGAFWLPLVLADEAHTYGVACRAAGEAAGYARGLAEAKRDAERYRWLRAVESIARVCHEVNRAYCESLGDTSQVSWEEAPEWQRESARLGVDLHLSGDFPPSASHESWMMQKQMDGWVYGPVKDVGRREHPCMVPFDDLPREQKSKDFIFRAVVRGVIAERDALIVASNPVSAGIGTDKECFVCDGSGEVKP